MKFKIALIIIILLISVGCSKNIVKKEDFLNIADYNGYIIRENKDEYKGYNYIKNVYFAINREGMYFIQFLELDSDNNAKNFFEYNKVEFAKDNTEVINKKSYKYNDYEFYHLETKDSYKLIIRSKNNIIYIDAPINYLEEINEFLDELNIEY